jgi:hypothetical protein
VLSAANCPAFLNVTAGKPPSRRIHVISRHDDIWLMSWVQLLKKEKKKRANATGFTTSVFARSRVGTGYQPHSALHQQDASKDGWSLRRSSPPTAVHRHLSSPISYYQSHSGSLSDALSSHRRGLLCSPRNLSNTFSNTSLHRYMRIDTTVLCPRMFLAILLFCRYPPGTAQQCQWRIDRTPSLPATT